MSTKAQIVEIETHHKMLLALRQQQQKSNSVEIQPQKKCLCQRRYIHMRYAVLLQDDCRQNASRVQSSQKVSGLTGRR